MEIIIENHNLIGHANPAITYFSMKIFFCKDMRTDTINIVKNCPEFLIFNENKNINFNYPILIGNPFERIGIETIGPLVKTEGETDILLSVSIIFKNIFHYKLHLIKQQKL